MRILSPVLLFSGAMASPPSPPTVCSLFTTLPSGITCTSTSATNAKLVGTSSVGPWTLGGPSPFNVAISALSLSATAEFDVCATPATMQFDATLSIPLPDGGSLPAELNQMIEDAVSEETAGTLTWNSPTLSISKKVSMGTSAEIDLPFFYAGGFAVKAKLNLAVSGSISAFKVNLNLGMCVALSGVLSKLMPAGKKELCLDEMPDCTGCAANKACPWTAKEFPCAGDTSCPLVSGESYCTDASWDPCKRFDILTTDGDERLAADVACAALGSPNVPALLDNPPYTILEDTYDFAKLCPLPPSPPPSPPQPPATTTVVITTDALAHWLHPHIAAMRTSLATVASVNESYVDVAVVAVDADPTDGTTVTLKVRTAPALAAAMAATLKTKFSGAMAAANWLADTTGLAIAVVTVTSVTEAGQTDTGGGSGMSGGAIAGVVIGTLAGIGILVGVVVKVTSSGQPMIKQTQMEEGRR